MSSDKRCCVPGCNTSSGTPALKVTSGDAVEGTNNQDQTTTSTPALKVTSGDAVEAQDQNTTAKVPHVTKSTPQLKRKYVKLNLILEKGQKPPKKITKIDGSLLDLNKLKLLLQKQKTVSDDGNPQELEDHHEDPRSPSPEPDIEVNICRICVQDYSKLISIESYGLRTAYEQLTGVSVEHDDGLPRELCVECATLLDKYHKFRDKSIKGDQLLRQIYNQDGVTEKIPLGEIEQAITNLASKIDYSAEVTCIDIEPEDTESKLTESKDESNDKTDISKTNENKVIETDLDMSVDEPVDEEWLDLSEDEDMRSQKETSVHDIDDEVSIKEEELDLDGDHTDPLHTVDVNTQTEVQSISEPESQDENLHKDTRIQRRSSYKQPESQHISPEKQLETQQIVLDKLKTRKSLLNQPERQLSNVNKDLSCVMRPKKTIRELNRSEIQQISLLKQQRKQDLSLLKQPRKVIISLLKQPRKQDLSLLNQPESQLINIVKDPDTKHINVVKNPETRNIKKPKSQHINIVKDPETQQISLIEQPRDISLSKDTNIQQESQIKAHYSIQKLDVRDQKAKHLRKRMFADYLISTYKCELCYEGFQTENDLERHNVHDADQGQLLCTICRCRFRELQHLKEHVQDRHQYIYNCRMCHRDILTRTQALQHIKEHLPFVYLNR